MHSRSPSAGPPSRGAGGLVEPSRPGVDDRAFFDANGYLGPFRVLPRKEAEARRDRILDEVIGQDAHQLSGDRSQSRHLDSLQVYELCTLPAMIDRVACLYGPDLLLWRSYFWCKQPGDAEVAWHQDLTNWPLEPMVNVTAWIALDPTTRENGCVEIIPGSHAGVYPTSSTTGDPLTDCVSDEFVDRGRAIPLEMEPGECFLFTEKLLHYSAANRSPLRRLGLAVRITTPGVRVDSERLNGGRHSCIVVQGQDRFGVNRLQDPPSHG